MMDCNNFIGKTLYYIYVDLENNYEIKSIPYTILGVLGESNKFYSVINPNSIQDVKNVCVFHVEHKSVLMRSDLDFEDAPLDYKIFGVITYDFNEEAGKERLALTIYEDVQIYSSEIEEYRQIALNLIAPTSIEGKTVRLKNGKPFAIIHGNPVYQGVISKCNHNGEVLIDFVGESADTFCGIVDLQDIEFISNI